jgi:hypothetical protein
VYGGERQQQADRPSHHQHLSAGEFARSDPHVQLDPPGAGQVIGATPGNLGTAVFGYCVVEGPGVSKSKTPVTLCLQPANGNDCIAAVSIP